MGLKENVILGHLVPAGTGFRTHQESEVRLNAALVGKVEETTPAEPPAAEAPPAETEELVDAT